MRERDSERGSKEAHSHFADRPRRITPSPRREKSHASQENTLSNVFPGGEKSEGRQGFDNFGDYFRENPVAERPMREEAPSLQETPVEKKPTPKDMPRRKVVDVSTDEKSTDKKSTSSSQEASTAPLLRRERPPIRKKGVKEKTMVEEVRQRSGYREGTQPPPIPKELHARKEVAVSLVGRLRDHIEMKVDRSTLSERRKLILEAFKTDPQVLENQGIRVIVRGPVDNEGKLVVTDPLTSNYEVFVAFESSQQNGSQKFIKSSRYALGGQGRTERVPFPKDLARIDNMVENAALLEVHPATPKDHYEQVIKEINVVDKYIAQQSFERNRQYDRSQSVFSNTNEEITPAKLHQKKYRLIRDYLLAAEKLKRNNPELESLPPLYFFEEHEDKIHGNLKLKQTIERSYPGRIIDPRRAVFISDMGGETNTKINIRVLKWQAAQYRAGTTSDENEIAYQISEILGL